MNKETATFLEKTGAALTGSGRLAWCLPLLALLAFGGCSKAPSASEGEKVLKYRIHEPLMMVGFHKINGQYGKILNAEGVEVESYSLEYEADIEATQRCELLDPANRSVWLTTLAASNAVFPIYTNNILNSGQRFRMGGTIVFEKTENGWSEVKADKRIY